MRTLFARFDRALGVGYDERITNLVLLILTLTLPIIYAASV